MFIYMYESELRLNKNNIAIKILLKEVLIV
jgi:hypothetical protein